MRILRFIPAFFLFTLLMNPILMPEQVYAVHCCAEGECHWYCKCPGDSLACPWYPKPQVASGMSDIKLVHVALPVSAKNPDTTEGLMNLRRSSKCFLDRIALNLLGNTRNGLKFEPVRFDEKAFQEQTVALQMEVDKANYGVK